MARMRTSSGRAKSSRFILRSVWIVSAMLAALDDDNVGPHTRRGTVSGEARAGAGGGGGGTHNAPLEVVAAAAQHAQGVAGVVAVNEHRRRHDVNGGLGARVLQVLELGEGRVPLVDIIGRLKVLGRQSDRPERRRRRVLDLVHHDAILPIALACTRRSSARR